MDNLSLVTLIVTLAIVLGIFGISYFTKRKKINQRENIIKKFAKLNDCESGKMFHFGKLSIGFDTNGKNLLFYSNLGEIDNIRIIPLEKVESVEIIKKTRNVNLEREEQFVTDNLTLSFNLKNNSLQKLEFFNSDYGNLNLSGELQIIEEWKEKIESMIKIQKNQFSNIGKQQMSFS